MDFEAKALGVWSDISDALADEFTSDQVRACVAAIAAALSSVESETREKCAKIADRFGCGTEGCDQHSGDLIAAAIRKGD